MVPKVFIPLNYMPLTSSGKIDRKKLQSIATTLTATELAAYSGQREEHSAPTTEKEVRMQQLWARVLNIRPETISRYDNFIRLGGDSVLAMKLVALAREDEIQVTVAMCSKANTFRISENTHISGQEDRRASEGYPWFRSYQQPSSVIVDT
jgi:aryl carrier-like protein